MKTVKVTKMAKKSLAAVLSFATLISSVCISNAFATGTAPRGKVDYEQSVAYDFDTTTEIPSIFKSTGNGITKTIENNELKVATSPRNTQTMQIDISDWAGKSRENKGVLTYSFDYTADATADVTDTYIMVGSNSTAKGFTLGMLNKSTLKNVTETAGVNNAYALSGSTHKVTIKFDFTKGMYAIYADGKCVSHPFTYFTDKTVENDSVTYKCTDADKFILYFRTYNGSETDDYAYSIDNFKAEYSERAIVEETAVETFDDDTLEFINGSNGQLAVSNGTIKVTNKAGADTFFRIQPNLALGKERANGTITYTFDIQKPINDITIKVGGDGSTTSFPLGVLTSSGFSGTSGSENASLEWGNKGTDDWNRVTVAIDQKEGRAKINIGGGKTCVYTLTEEQKEMDLFTLHTRVWVGSDKSAWDFYVDNVKATYSERAISEATAVEDFEGEKITSALTVTGGSHTVADDTSNKVDKISNAVEKNTRVIYKPSFPQGADNQNGVVKYKFDYKIEDNKSTSLYLGEVGSANRISVGVLGQNGFHAENKRYGDLDAVWHTIEMAVDLIQNTVSVTVDNVETYNKAISDDELYVTNNGETTTTKKNLLTFFIDTWVAENGTAWDYYIDNLSAEYTEIAPVVTDVTATSGDTEYDILGVASNVDKINVKFNTPVDTTGCSIKLCVVVEDNEVQMPYHASLNTTGDVLTFRLSNDNGYIDFNGNYKIYINSINSKAGVPMELAEAYCFFTGTDKIFGVENAALEYKTDGAYAPLTEIANLKGATKIKAATTVTNYIIDSQKSVKYLLAMYKGGVLTNVSVKDVDISTTGTASTEFDVSGVAKSDIDKVALYVWNDSMAAPMCTAYTVEAQ